MTIQINRVGSESGITFSHPRDIFREIKDTLVAVGWSVPRSGTGTGQSYDTDDLWTSLAAINDLQRPWVEVSSPDGAHNFIFQCTVSYSDALWRIKWSPTPFTGGTPDEETCGSSPDEVVLLGGGTDASPSGTSCCDGTDTARVLYMGCDDAAPYGLWAHVHFQSGGGSDTFLALDPLAPGSYDPSDPHPYVIYRPVADPFMDSTYINLQNVLMYVDGSWTFGGAGEMFGWGSSGRVFPDDAGTDPINNSDISLPCIYGRNTDLPAPNGWKGVSSLFEISGVVRNNGDTASRDSARDRVYVVSGQVSTAWNGEVPTV